MATDTAPSSTAFASNSSKRSPNNRNDYCANTSSDARFTCNICFDAVTEPVVTQCGHLYCWPCLFRWLAPGMKPQERVSLGMQPIYVPLDESRRVCPVCKSQCSVPTVVPIYVKTDNEEVPANAANRQNNNDNLRGETQEEEEKKEESSEELGQNRRRDEAGHSSQQHEEEQQQQQMGLDIDGDLDDHHPEPPVPEVSIPASIEPLSSAGVRQRRRPVTVTEEATPVVAPRRPTPATTAASATTNEASASLVQRAHSPSRNSHPPPHRASLSYGLVLAMHQTLLNATRDQRQNNNSNNHHNTRDNNNGPSSPEEAIPSLHYPERRNPLSSDGTANHASSENMMMMDTDPAATLFLSRLLLGLSLFVLFCLLVF